MDEEKEKAFMLNYSCNLTHYVTITIKEGKCNIYIYELIDH